MKANNFILGLLMALALVSCKDDSKKGTDENAQKVEAKKIAYTVTLNAIVSENDGFQLFYKEADQIPYEESTILSVDVKGSSAPQDIVFNIEEGELPNFIRIDLGSNEKQQPITINSLKFTHNGKSFDLLGEYLLAYFAVNQSVSVLKSDKGIILKTIKPQGGEYDPVIYSGEALFHKIEELSLSK